MKKLNNMQKGHTDAMADTIVSMTFAMAETIAFIAPPMADMTEPWVRTLRLNGGQNTSV